MFARRDPAIADPLDPGFGALEHVCHDQGGEFVPATLWWANDMVPFLAQWFQRSPLTEHATEGFTAMKLAISSAVAARNNYDNHKGQLYTEAVDADSEYARALRRDELALNVPPCEKRSIKTSHTWHRPHRLGNVLLLKKFQKGKERG